MGERSREARYGRGKSEMSPSGEWRPRVGSGACRLSGPGWVYLGPQGIMGDPPGSAVAGKAPGLAQDPPTCL